MTPTISKRTTVEIHIHGAITNQVDVANTLCFEKMETCQSSTLGRVSQQSESSEAVAEEVSGEEAHGQ